MKPRSLVGNLIVLSSAKAKQYAHERNLYALVLPVIIRFSELHPIVSPTNYIVLAPALRR